MNALSTLSFEPDLPLLGIAAWSGTGKTTLLEKLLPVLREQGLKVAVIKHAHHEFDVDKPGKDSHRLRCAGATPMLVASHKRLALMMETPGQEEPDLPALVESLRCYSPDLILVEGFKTWPFPKLALHRDTCGDTSLVQDTWVRAVATNQPEALTLKEGVEVLDIDDMADIAAWVKKWPARWKASLA
ncbi:molybdopterin-guanine dinucleotide biosynthesis protein B [Halomonas sediminis]